MSETAGRRVKVIINPEANHGTARDIIAKVENAFTDWENTDVRITEYAGETTEIAEGLGSRDTIIIVGGDGTVFEAVNGLAKAGKTDVTLGIIPAGSGNDLCKALNIPRDFDRALAVIKQRHVEQIDLGHVNEFFFSNSLAVGFDARVAHLANEIKEETRKSGLSLYLTALLRIVFKDYYCHDVRISIDGGDWIEKKILLAAVNNGKIYGGGFKITPEADNRDGLLEVCVIDALPRSQLLWRLPFAVMGRHRWMKPATFYKAKSVRIESKTELPAALDGELILSKYYDARVIPNALSVICREP